MDSHGVTNHLLEGVHCQIIEGCANLREWQNWTISQCTEFSQMISDETHDEFNQIMVKSVLSV